MIVQPRDAGWIEVICGPMFSGKTEELIRRLKRASYAGQTLQIFKPRLDDRYDEETIVSHDDTELASRPVESTAELAEAIDPSIEVLGIDEIQFFDTDIVDLCAELTETGCRVVVAGLDLDYRGEPFEPVPTLLARAEYVTKLLAICVQCGNPASHSYRLAEDPQQVLVGSDDAYEARCRGCFRDGYPASGFSGDGTSHEG
jgi:thymidine kinase